MKMRPTPLQLMSSMFGSADQRLEDAEADLVAQHDVLERVELFRRHRDLVVFPVDVLLLAAEGEEALAAAIAAAPAATTSAADLDVVIHGVEEDFCLLLVVFAALELVDVVEQVGSILALIQLRSVSPSEGSMDDVGVAGVLRVAEDVDEEPAADGIDEVLELASPALALRLLVEVRLAAAPRGRGSRGSRRDGGVPRRPRAGRGASPPWDPLEVAAVAVVLDGAWGAFSLVLSRFRSCLRLRHRDDPHTQVRLDVEGHDVAGALGGAAYLGDLQDLDQLCAHLLHAQAQVGVADRAQTREQLLVEA